LRGGREVVPGAGNANCSGSSSGDEAVDAIVERGDQRQGAGNVRCQATTSPIDRGQE
jgi:hypothetical protein